MNVTSILTKDYENKPPSSPKKTNPIQTQSNPICSELVEPISKACFLPVLLFSILPGDWLHVDFEQLGPADKPSVVRLFLQV